MPDRSPSLPIGAEIAGGCDPMLPYADGQPLSFGQCCDGIPVYIYAHGVIIRGSASKTILQGQPAVVELVVAGSHLWLRFYADGVEDAVYVLPEEVTLRYRRVSP